jgi:hypothetical protein
MEMLVVGILDNAISSDMGTYLPGFRFILSLSMFSGSAIGRGVRVPLVGGHVGVRRVSDGVRKVGAGQLKKQRPRVAVALTWAAADGALFNKG